MLAGETSAFYPADVSELFSANQDLDQSRAPRRCRTGSGLDPNQNEALLRPRRDHAQSPIRQQSRKRHSSAQNETSKRPRPLRDSSQP